jgi:hypothetical protein
MLMAVSERAGEEWRGKIGRLSQADMEEFLSGDVLCRLSCLDTERWPYTVPIWFAYRDDRFYIIPRERSVWARYVQRDPRVFLCIDEQGRQRRVLVRGEAHVIEEPNVGGEWVEIAKEMSYRYLGEHGPDCMVPTLNEPRWLILGKPQKITTWQAWTGRALQALPVVTHDAARLLNSWARWLIPSINCAEGAGPGEADPAGLPSIVTVTMRARRRELPPLPPRSRALPSGRPHIPHA